jgi:hypothetical protein
MKPRGYCLALAPAALFAAACSSAPEGGLVRCTPGETAACTCDGGNGTKTCRANGRFSACVCGTPGLPILELGGEPDPTDAADRLLGFGAVPLDGSAEATIWVRNAGGGVLTLELSTVERPFSVREEPPASLAPGEAVTLRFRFAPTHRGDVDAFVSILSNVGNPRIRLAGEGFEALASCVPNPLDLGTVVVGIPAPFALVCANHASEPWPAVAGVEGTDAGAVAVTLDGPLPAADGAWHLAGTVTATHEGPLTAGILLGAGGAPVAAVPLVAVARTESLEVPALVDLGFVSPGVTAATSFEVKNYAPAPRTVEAGWLSPGADTQLESRTAFPLALPAAVAGVPGVATIQVAIAARPDRLGTRADGQLLLRLDGEDAPRSVALTAFVGGPRISCSPAALDFGTVGVGYPTTLSLACANVGTDDPTREDDALVVRVSSPAPGIAAAIREGRAGYGVGEPLTVDVTLTPAAAGPIDGELRLETNAFDVPGGTIAVPLHAVALDLAPCDFRVAPSTLDFARAVRRDGNILEFGVQNRGAGPCQVRNLRLSDGCEAFSLPAGPAPTALVAPGATFRVPVEFRPPGSGAEGYHCEARLEVSNPDAGAVVVPLAGVGLDPCLWFAREVANFGGVVPGCASAALAMTAVDACPGTRAVRGVELAPTASGDFAVEDVTAPGAGGALVSFRVRYRPAEEGIDFGGVYVYADGDVPYFVPLVGRGSLDPTRTDTFEQNDRPKVDALFVIDNAASQDEQLLLAASVTPLLSFAQARGVDFQIGVTTDGLQPGGSCPGGASGGESGRLVPVNNLRPRVVTPQTPSRNGVLAENFKVGTCGSEHRLLDATLLALTPPAIDNCDDPRFAEPNDGNCGFLRDPAHLSIVAVSRISDASVGTPSSYVAAFRSLKPPRRPELLGFHAITGDRGTGCTLPGGVVVPRGDRLIEVVDALGGSFHSICTSDWTQLARELSADVFGYEACFPLGSEPEPGADGVFGEGDLAVELNGVVVAPVSGAGAAVWHYAATQHAVCFAPTAFPNPGTQLDVTYRAACQQP